MTKEEELLAAINAAPSDDLPRLVYADWLDEHDDPNRGELIRIQCSLASGLDWRTGRPFGKGHIEPFQIRERELIAGMCRAPAPVDGELPAIRELTPEIAAIIAQHPPRSRIELIAFKRGMIQNLDLSNSPVTSLPPNLHVNGLLNVSNTNITAIPPDIYLGGTLHARDTRITALPTGLHVRGNLYLAHTLITSLPSGLDVDGHIIAEHSLITSLSSDLHIGGSLFLRHSLLAELPPNLHIGKDLDVCFTQITSLPPGLVVGSAGKRGNLNVSNMAITSLPHDLRVFGTIDFRCTGIRGEAVRQILDMPKLIPWYTADTLRL